MKLLKVISLTLTLTLASNAYASAFKLIDTLADAVATKAMIQSKGIIDSAQVHKLSRMLNMAVTGISQNGKAPSQKELKNLGKLITDADDKKKYDEALSLLQRDPKNISKEELITLYNRLAFISQRYGLSKKAKMTCAPCMDKEMADLGVEYMLVELRDSTSKTIFKRMARNAPTPEKASNYMRKELKSQGFEQSIRVAPHEEEAVVYMLHLEKYGTEELKGLAADIKAVSKTRSGKFDLFDEANGHKFYNIFASELSPSDVTVWRNLLKDTKEVMEKENLDTMDAFYSVLERRAKSLKNVSDREDLLAKLDFIKNNKCFAKK